MKLLLVVDPLETLQPFMDTSLLMASEANKRGYEVSTVVANKIGRDSNGCFGSISRFHYDKTVEKPVEQFADQPQKLYFDEFDIVIMRKDPPVDEFFIGCLYAMEHTNACVLNNPKGLRLFNEKINMIAWPDLIPDTILSPDSSEILKFIRSFEHGGVIKPINMFGGKGVERALADDPNLETMINQATENGSKFIIAQRFVPNVTRGDKRIYLVDGEIIGAINRIPKEGEWRANISLGATTVGAEVTTRDQDIVNGIAPTLKELDLPITCIDIIGDYLTEVNVTSPTGVVQINETTGDNKERHIIDYLETRLK